MTDGPLFSDTAEVAPTRVPAACIACRTEDPVPEHHTHDRQPGAPVIGNPPPATLPEAVPPPPEHPDEPVIPGVVDPHGHLDLWDRLTHEGEGPVSYGWFLAFRDLGGARRIRTVADSVGRSRQYLEQVSARFRWVERATAWDREQARVFAERVADRRAQLVEQHAKVGTDLVEKAQAMLVKLDDGKWTVDNALRAIDLGVKVQRLAAGAPTDLTGRGTDPAAPPQGLAELTEEERTARMLELAAELAARAERAPVPTDDTTEEPTSD